MQRHKQVEKEGIFEQMFECLPNAVALTNDAGNILYSNTAFKSLTSGCHRPGSAASIDDLLVSKDPSKPSIVANYLRAKLANAEFKDRFLLPDGKRISMRVTLSRLSQGICLSLIPLSELSEDANRYDDLNNLYTTLIEKNNELTGINKELNRSNQELSQYAYVASHDLQEPLRKIRIFSDILTGNMQLSPKDRFIASKINKASERMGFLIRDLLSYSKLIKTDVLTEEVNLNEILRAVINDFEMTIQEKKAVVQFYELPVINAVKLHMNQLFYNLLSNALKFTSPGQAPVIEISSEVLTPDQVAQHIQQVANSRNFIRIVFKDNGIGFDNQNAEKIFEVFQRLATKDKYQGSGIGLALCRRIVQNHGGMMSADSEPGKGSAFSIIIPTQKLA